jgi:hypothetical protein
VSLLDEEMMDGARSAEGNSALALVGIARDSEKQVTEKGQRPFVPNFRSKEKSDACAATDHGRIQGTHCNMVTSDKVQKEVKARAWFDH